MQIFSNIVTIIDVIYLIVLTMMLVASFAIQTELAGVIRTLLIVMFSASAILLPLSLVAELWLLSTILAGCVAVLIFAYLPRLLPKQRERPTDKQVLSLLTFNLETAGEGELGQITEIIQEKAPDIVGFQELSHEGAAHFRQVFADRYPHQKLYPQDNAHAGQGLLSRYPIAESEYYRWERAPEKLGNIQAVLEVDGREMGLHVLHPFPPISLSEGFNAEEHDKEVDELLQRLATDDRPTLLMGDFNMTEHLESYRQITEHFTDAYKAVGEMGLGLTFPDGDRLTAPRLIRLDYVFYDDHFEGVLASTVERSGASDHRPLYVEVTFNQENA